MFSFGRTSRSESRASDRQQQASGKSSIFSLSRKSSIASIKDAISGHSSVQSSGYSSAHTSAYTSAYNSRPPSALLPMRHVDSSCDIQASQISPVSAKAAALLGIPNQASGEQSPTVTSKPWYSRGRKLKRRSSQASMVSANATEIEGSQSRRGSNSVPTTPHTPNFHISGPMSFQHITHTSPQHFSKMKNSHSQNDLLAEFSAVRASQVPQRALRGIRAGEIHSRSPSVDTFDRTLASKDSRESMASSVAPSPTAMQNPKSSASLPSPTHHWHRLRHPPGNLPPWTATRLSLHGYGTNSPTHSPTSPHHIPPEEVGLAVPLEDGRGWHHPYADDDNPSQSGDGDHGFHAVSTPGETAWELAPNSPLPFDLLPSLCEEDESSSRPVSSVTTINRGSVIHRGHNGAATNNSTGRLPTNSRLANGDETLSGIPIMEMDEGDRVVSVIHHPPQQASLDGAATADEGLFSSWNAESDTESVADGEALLEWVSPGHRWSKEPDAASSPSSRAKSWRDSQASTIPNSGPDDYNKLLDEIAELNGPISAWHVDSAPVTNTPLARGQSHIPAANAYPMSPEDGDEPPAFDPYTAPLPHRPDSLSSQTATGRPEARVSSMQSHGTSPRLSGDKSKPKRTSSTSKRVAFVEDKAEPIKKNGTPVSKIPRPVRRHGSSTSSITFEADRNAPVAVPDLPETELSWVTHQRHSTGQVQRSKSTGHSRKLSSPDTARTSPHRRSNSSRSNRDAVTTATNAGYSFVRISGPAATRVSS